MERVRRQDGRMAVARSEAAELGLDLIWAEPRGVEDGFALRQPSGSSRRGGRGRAALVVECDPLDHACVGNQ